MASWLLLVFALIGAVLVVNATWPLRGPKTMVAGWIGVLITVDLAFVHIALQLIVAAILGYFGAFDAMPGKIAAVFMLVSAVMLIRLWLPNLEAGKVAEKVAAELQLVDAEPMPAGSALLPVPPTRKGVRIARDIEFFRVQDTSLKLDVYQPESADEQCPALVYVHGGAWQYGDKKDQGVLLCNHLATQGWVCFNVNYRLSPDASWPEHLIDVKAALAWVREHADDYGVDASFIAISGSSAGAHISAMAALTANDAAYQPGFEAADTRVQAVVTSYGLYDLTDRLGAHHPEYLTEMVGPLILKASPDTEMSLFSAASPRDFVDKASQPWLIIHGDEDTLAPVVEARDFADALRRDSAVMVGYAELPGAAHGFDLYSNPRAIAAIDLTTRFLATAHSRHA